MPGLNIMVKSCTKCSTKAEDWWRFCALCGLKINQPSPPKITQAQGYSPGTYITTDGIAITQSGDKTSKRVGVIGKGQTVQITEICNIPGQERIRGKYNRGWITMKDTSTNRTWVRKITGAKPPVSECGPNTTSAGKLEAGVKYAVKSVSSGKYLDGRNPEHKNPLLQERTPVGDKFLHWTVEFMDGHMALRSVSSGRYLDGRGGQKEPELTIRNRAHIAEKTYSKFLKWKIYPVGDGTFGLRSISSGRHLDGRNGKKNPLMMNGSPAFDKRFQWEFVKVSSNDVKEKRKPQTSPVGGAQLPPPTTTPPSATLETGVKYAIQNVSSGKYLDGRDSIHTNPLMTSRVDINNGATRNPKVDKFLNWTVEYVDGHAALKSFSSSNYLNGGSIEPILSKYQPAGNKLLQWKIYRVDGKYAICNAQSSLHLDGKGRGPRRNKPLMKRASAAGDKDLQWEFVKMTGKASRPEPAPARPKPTSHPEKKPTPLKPAPATPQKPSQQSFVKPGVYFIKSHHGKFVTVNYNNKQITARSGNMQTWEKITIQRISGGRYTLRSAHNTYIGAEPSGRVNAVQLHSKDWESWRIEKRGGKFAFKSFHGKWLTADRDGTLRTKNCEVRSWELFTLMGDAATGHKLKAGATYAIRSVSSGRFLDGQSGYAKKPKLTNRSPGGDKFLHWTVEFVNGRVAFKSNSSQMYLDGGMGDKEPALCRGDPSGNSFLQWKINQVDGKYAICSASSGRHLDGRNPQHEDPFLSIRKNPAGDKFLQWEFVDM